MTPDELAKIEQLIDLKIERSRYRSATPDYLTRKGGTEFN